MSKSTCRFYSCVMYILLHKTILEHDNWVEEVTKVKLPVNSRVLLAGF